MTTGPDQLAAFYNRRWSTADVSDAKKLRGGKISEVVAREATRPLEILELGCGTGWLCNELTRFGTCLGVDVSPVAIEQATLAFPTAHFECVDVASWRPDRTYDVVVSHEVIEHLRDQRVHLELARDALHPGGLLVLTTPNAFAAYAADAGVRHSYEMQPIENWLYVDEVRTLLEQTGFIIERLTTIVAWRSYRSRLLRMIASSRVDALTSRLGAGSPWSRAKGRLGLNTSIFAVARRR